MTRLFYLSVILVLIFNTTAFADSSRMIIDVEEDVLVDKAELNSPRSSSLMTGFDGTRTEFVLPNENSIKPVVLYNKPEPIVTFLKFDLKKIPSSTLFETVSIDDSTIKLFFPEPDKSDATLYVFTVKYCENNQWKEDDVMWDSRPCKGDVEAIDTTVIREEDIPGFVELDIVGAINKVQEKGESKITLVLEAQPILFDVEELDSSDIGKVTNFIKNNWKKFTLEDFSVDRQALTRDNFEGRVDRELGGIWDKYKDENMLELKFVDVKFIDGNLYSMNYTAINSHIMHVTSSESKQFGHATSPTILIDYSVGPSVFNDAIIFTLTIILPTLTIVVPVVIWIYKKSK